MIYLATNDINDVAGFQAYDTTAGRYDSNYVSQGLLRTSLGSRAWPCFVGHQQDVSTDDEAWFHFELWAEDTWSRSSDDGAWLRLLGENGKILAFIDVDNGAATARVYNNSGNHTDAASTFVIPEGTLESFDIMYKDDLTTCTFEIYLSGTLLTSASRNSTGTRTMPHAIQFDHNDITIYNGDWVYSQFIFANESTIGMKMQKIRPNAVGNYTDLASDVTTVSNDDPSSGWISNTHGDKQSFTTTGYTLPAGRAVHSVNVRTDMRTAVTGVQHIRPFVRIASTDYDLGADLTPYNNSKRGLLGSMWVRNPATNTDWTEAEIQALEAGFEIRT